MQTTIKLRLNYVAYLQIFPAGMLKIVQMKPKKIYDSPRAFRCFQNFCYISSVKLNFYGVCLYHGCHYQI